MVLHQYKATVQVLVIHISSRVSLEAASGIQPGENATDHTATYLKRVDDLFSEIQTSLTGLMQPPKEIVVQ